MRQAATLFIFGLLLLIVVFIFLSHSLAIVQRVAVVDSLTGSAEVVKNGEGPPVGLKVGQLVHAGDVIRTGADGSVELRWARWAGGMRIKVGPNTTFTVKRSVVNRSSKDAESRLRVDAGTIWVRIRKALTGKSKFEVETPTAVAAVRGTTFSVTVERDGTSQVTVWKGAVEVAGAKGGAVVVSGGSSFTAGQAVGGAPQPMSEAEQEQWQQQTSMIGPFLAVEAPGDGATLASPSVTVSGRTEPDSELTVNGTTTAVSKEGHFSAAIELAAGAQTVEVRATAPDGSETVVGRRVSVEAAAAEQPSP